VPMAAAIALMFVLQPSTPPSPGAGSHVTAEINAEASRPFKPVAAQNLLLNRSDEGVVTLADGRAARRVRESYLDTITWKNPQTHASLQWTIPREEIRVVPVAYQ
jgi:hypothetical protein